MKQVLFVDCCIRKEQSRTKKIADAFFSRLDPKRFAVTTLDLMQTAPRYFSGDYFWQREKLLQSGELGDPRFDLARQFASADVIVIAAPFWDLSFPALLKVYVEQVSLEGVTFQTGEKGLTGLCRASHMVYLTSRGGFFCGSDMEMGSRYMQAMSRFFGIAQYHAIAADGMDVQGFDSQKELDRACAEAAAYAERLS